MSEPKAVKVFPTGSVLVGHTARNFASRLGYSGPARVIGVWWEPCGDEACWMDGVTTMCGAEWHVYLNLVQALEPALVAYFGTIDGRYRLGSSDATATHMLLFDHETGEVRIIDRENGERWLGALALYYGYPAPAWAKDASLKLREAGWQVGPTGARTPNEVGG